MKIAVFEVEEREKATFNSLGAAHSVQLVAESLLPENAAAYADAEIISTFIYSNLGRETLSQLPMLKLIATRSTGYDHIDIDYLRDQEIVLVNVPTYGETTVAEHVFALLLAIFHRLPEAIERARSGRFSPEGLQGFDLAGKTLGVIGTGNIGRHVARIACGFSMDVVANDIRPDMQFAAKYDVRYLSFDEVLEVSDVISLHVPATLETRNLLSFDAFTRMKGGVVVINTARGDLIDSHALIMALRSGKVAGAGLDVLADEPLIREEVELICSLQDNRHDLRNLVADHILLHMPNVIVTPHSAFNTEEAVQRIVETTVENIKSFINGHTQNIVGSNP